MGAQRKAAFEQELAEINAATERAGTEAWQPQQLASVGMKVAQDGRRRTLLEVLGYGADLSVVEHIAPWFLGVTERVRQYVTTQARYSGYLTRQNREIKQLEAETEIRFPPQMDFAGIGGLSSEMKERLAQAQPESFSAAQRIPGITPSALMAILAYLRKGQEHTHAG